MLKGLVTAVTVGAVLGCAGTAQAAPDDVKYIVIKDGSDICDVLDSHGVTGGVLMRIGTTLVDLYPITMREAGQVIASSVVLFCDYHRGDLMDAADAMTGAKHKTIAI